MKMGFPFSSYQCIFVLQLVRKRSLYHKEFFLFTYQQEACLQSGAFPILQKSPHFFNGKEAKERLNPCFFPVISCQQERLISSRLSFIETYSTCAVTRASYFFTKVQDFLKCSFWQTTILPSPLALRTDIEFPQLSQENR